jgi:hypothetical protein
MEYPYYKTIYKINKKKIKKIIKNFKSSFYKQVPDELKKYNLEKYNNEYIIIKDKWDDNFELNNLTDVFSETVRVKCQFLDKISPYDYWQKNMTEIKSKNDDIHKMRDYIYTHTKLCNNFRISLALTILHLFKPKKWLDISAGWGDRLLAAMFSDLDLYYSTDPNLDLHPCYKKMIDTFASDKSKFIIDNKGFETDEFIIPYNDFDIVFSSPPFFTLEKYSTYENDSITKYNNEKDWTESFLLKSIYKAVNHLKIGGYLLLYIDGSKYVMQQLFTLNKLMKYNGIIYYYDNKPRAIYVWKKINNI